MKLQVIVGVKGQAYHEVSKRIDTLHQEVSKQIADPRTVVHVAVPRS